MIILIYIHFAAIVTYVYFWGLLTAQRIHDPINKALRLFVLVAFGWAFVELLLYFPFAYGNELFLKRLTGLFWAPVTFVFLRFIYVLINQKKDWIYYILALGTGASAALYLTTDLGVSDCIRHDWGVQPINSPMHSYLTIFPALSGLQAIFMSLVALRKQSSLELKGPLRLMAAGAFVSLVFGFTFNLVIPNFLDMTMFPRIGFASTIPLFLFIHRAIIRYKFLAMDVEQLGEELFETLHDGIILIDRAGVVRRMNRSASKIFGISDDDVRGFRISNFLENYDPGKKMAEKEVSVVRGGETRHLLLSSSPNLRGGLVVGQVLILRDITAQKEADGLLEFKKARLEEEVEQQKIELEQARKGERVGMAAGVIAHDFNNILVAIIGYSTLAKEELSPDHPLWSDYEEILEAGRRARDIVAQILLFSRRGEEKWRLLNLRDELEDTLKLLKVSLPVNITLDLKIGEDSGYVFAAPTRLRQIVMNICTNAYQAMQDTGGVLTVALKKFTPSEKFISGHRLLQRGRYAEIQITDTGEGMSPEKMSKIFEPFYTTKGQSEGTGLGLSTALRIAGEIGGIIVGEGSKGKGSTFNVYLPIWEKPEAELEKPGDSKNVLVVDEDESIGLLCKRTLEPLGYIVDAHLSPVDALEVFDEDISRFDLVIADQEMLEMTGIAFENHLLNARPNLPLLMIASRVSRITYPSATTTIEEEEPLTKPFDQDELLAAVEEALSG